ncbi:hypothetical protein [Sphingomonas phyllosphaerae]|uniref:hypothetical protein n=1 Tax=Sphingomonas phyllosphaerae TaxID=257003 RepID=UPI00041D1588|nr:hypothetical protein [Sphingomonas phyllosphaerae]
MTARGQLHRLRAVQHLQAVACDLAVRDHAAAGEAVAAAQTATAHATAAAQAGAADWYRARAAGRFDPQHDLALAAALLTAEERVAACGQDAAGAAAALSHATDAWRDAEGRRRAGDAVARRLRQQATRAQDEAVADLMLTRLLQRRGG